MTDRDVGQVVVDWYKELLLGEAKMTTPSLYRRLKNKGATELQIMDVVNGLANSLEEDLLLPKVQV